MSLKINVAKQEIGKVIQDSYDREYGRIISFSTEAQAKVFHFMIERINGEISICPISQITTKEKSLILNTLWSEKVAQISEELTRRKVSQASGHSDNVITQIITVLDVIKKSLSLFSSHLREWYGLHFPELTDKVIEDNITLAELISSLGPRENFTIENIKKAFVFNGGECV